MPPKTQSKVAPVPLQPQTAGKHKKFTPRPPLPVAERLPKLYRGLTDQVNDGCFDNAKKTCKKILALDSSSTSAFQTLLFLHLHTDDYAAALALVETPPSESAGELLFERAYCLYRLHREGEALEVLQTIEGHGRREQHLEAQVRYRLGKYEEAQELYKSLIAGVSTSSSEYEDIHTNQASTAEQLDFMSRGYTSHLTASAVENPAAGLAAYTPSSGELETYVPSVPIGWATAGASSGAGTGKAAGVDKKHSAANATASSSAPPAKEKAPRTKPRHKLPKGAVLGKPFTQDPDRWLPLRQPASYLNAQASGKKKGGKEQTGLGTQGSTSGGGAAGGGAGGGGAGGGHGKGGGKKKKGKK